MVVVIAVDYNQERLTKAKRYGAETILLSNEISRATNF